jgi:hypothetical protein
VSSGDEDDKAPSSSSPSSAIFYIPSCVLRIESAFLIFLLV